MFYKNLLNSQFHKKKKNSTRNYFNPCIVNTPGIRISVRIFIGTDKEKYMVRLIGPPLEQQMRRHPTVCLTFFCNTFEKKTKKVT